MVVGECSSSCKWGSGPPTGDDDDGMVLVGKDGPSRRRRSAAYDFRVRLDVDESLYLAASLGLPVPAEV